MKKTVNIEIDDQLLMVALQLSHLKDKDEVVHTALEYYITHLKRLRLLTLQGQVKWDGDLDEMRGQ